MSRMDSQAQRLNQHRFLGRLNLHTGTPPSQFILYNHVTDYYYYGAGGHSFLTMRETLVLYLRDELAYDIVAIYNTSEGLSFPDQIMEQRYRDLVAGPPKERSYFNDGTGQPNADDRPPTAVARLDIAALGTLLRQPNALNGQIKRAAVIIERIQNLISHPPTPEDRPVLDQIQSWAALTNDNVSLLVADVASLDELPTALIGTHRSGVLQINVGLPDYSEINQLFISAEHGWLSREFGRSKRHIPRIEIEPDQRRDLIGRLEGHDILTVYSYFNDCARLEEPVLNMRALRLVASRTNDVWPALLDEANLKLVEDQLRLRVLGQEHALNQIFTELRDVRGRLHSQLQSGRVEEKLLTYFFFAGPTGVGKTEVFRALSATFVQVRSRKFNMPEYKEEHSVARFFGAPPGYIGHGRGELGEFLLENPAALVLFDEFEKAHPNVWKNFLTMLEGSLTTGDGIRVDLSQAIFIFTSNAGSVDLQPIQPEPLMTRSMQENIRKENLETVQRAMRHAGASPELIGRLINSIVSFNHMTEPVIEEIIQLKLKGLIQELSPLLGIKQFHSSVAAFLHDEYARQGRLGARILVQAADALRAGMRSLRRPGPIIYKSTDGVTSHTDSLENITAAYQRREQTEFTTSRCSPTRVDPTDERTPYSSVMPSVVAIMMFDGIGRFSGHCTGFFISESGHLVTRHQMIARYLQHSAVYGSDRLRVDLTIVGVSTYYDLAVLRPSQPLSEPVPFLLPTNSGAVEEGTEVVVLGLPQLSYEPLTQHVDLGPTEHYEQGRIVARQDQDGVFRLSAMPLKPGHSGSPLIQREDGSLIGMVLNRHASSGSGYALMSSVLQACLHDMGAIQNINQRDKP